MKLLIITPIIPNSFFDKIIVPTTVITAIFMFMYEKK